MRMRMLYLPIRIKRNDESNRKHLNKLIIDYLMKHKILGATVWNGFDSFGKRRRSTVTIEGITINMPLVIEVIDERSKLESLLPDLKTRIDDNGIVTIHDEVDVI